VRCSTDRILTTHVGSLARPSDLVGMLLAPRTGDEVSAAALATRVTSAVRDVVEQQRRCGLDVVNDGEMGKIGYATYVTDRLTGFDGSGPGPVASDLLDFPAYGRKLLGDAADRRMPVCTGPIAYKGDDAVRRDIENLAAALGDGAAGEAFITAASPGVISLFMQNAHYPTYESYAYALADAMKTEYDTISGAGFLLQVDCPDLAMGRHVAFAAATVKEFRSYAELQVEILNHALRDIAPDRIRMHLCWGNYEGPHNRDVAFADIIDIVLKARPAAILFEAANPRHEHEWMVFEETAVPHGKVLVPGTIDTTTNFIEHPELVAQRITRLARLVGRERVIAGADCGFAGYAGYNMVDPDIMWAKCQALVEGARVASSRLW